MSILSTIKAKIRDLNALEAALKEFGGTLHRNRTQFNQYGSHRQRNCDHAISFKHENMEMGLIKQPDGSYSLQYDHMLDRKVGKDAGKLMDAYNVHKTIMDSVAWGYAATELPREKDGTRSVEVLVYDY